MKDNNYYATFIEVADDCPLKSAEVPKQKGKEKSIPVLQYEMIANNPYKYTQEDVLFEVFATRNKTPKENKADERENFFQRVGHVCDARRWGNVMDGEFTLMKKGGWPFMALKPPLIKNTPRIKN